MHRYQPRIHLVRCRQTDDNNLRISDLQKEEHKTFIFPEAIFTAVTAYQNQLVSIYVDTSYVYELRYYTRDVARSDQKLD